MNPPGRAAGYHLGGGGPGANPGRTGVGFPAPGGCAVGPAAGLATGPERGRRGTLAGAALAVATAAFAAGAAAFAAGAAAGAAFGGPEGPFAAGAAFEPPPPPLVVSATTTAAAATATMPTAIPT